MYFSQVSLKKILILVLILSTHLLSTANAFDISSPFGWREHPISGEESFHNGIDIPAEEGADIAALLDGTVVYADWYDGYGYTVVLDHGDTFYTLYGHCSQLYVAAGTFVQAGQVIAAVGSTGYSTGPHLHFTAWSHDQYIDPMTILQ